MRELLGPTVSLTGTMLGFGMLCFMALASGAGLGTALFGSTCATFVLVVMARLGFGVCRFGQMERADET